MTGTQISHIVDDLARNCDTKQIHQFMSKYDLTKKECELLQWASVPAIKYRSMMFKYKTKLRLFQRDATAAYRKLSQATLDKDNKGIEQGLKLFLNALNTAQKPFDVDEEE